MMGWLEFVLAGLVFLIAHRIPTVPSMRKRLVVALSESGFVAAYSLISVALLIWVITAAGRAPYVEIWPPAPWQAWVPTLIMPAVCLLVAFSVGAPNPLSFSGGDAARFDPDRPGIVGVARHGLLWALALWSAAHMVPNGDLAHIVLFGTFCVFSIYGMYVIDRRKQRQMGHARWIELAHATSFYPFQSILDRRWIPASIAMDRWVYFRLAVAGITCVLMVAFHEALLGVHPLPSFADALFTSA
ncbi:MAG: NnrU family protein [Pseudomonadota bacterium]